MALRSSWSDPENWRWRDGAVAPGRAVVFDLDGVLSDATRRQHYLEWPRRDWETFFAECGEDELIAEVARVLECLDDGLRIVLLTARPIRVQAQTLAWLQRYELRDYGFELRLAFEDDQRNVDMFHDEGVPCVYIHSGYHT